MNIINKIQHHYKALRRLDALNAIRNQRAIDLQEKIGRIKKAREYIQEWSDIPMYELYDSVCKILMINTTNRAKEFCRAIIIDDDDEKLAKLLPSIPKQNGR